jgi:hypothetical protein
MGELKENKCSVKLKKVMAEQGDIYQCVNLATI